jgi:hypothetical protein
MEGTSLQFFSILLLIVVADCCCWLLCCMDHLLTFVSPWLH